MVASRSVVAWMVLLLQPVAAHSWIDCFDTNYTKIYDESASYIYGGEGGNGFCEGYGAGYPGRGDTSIGTEYTFKMLENEVEAGTAVCETVDADTYTNTDWRKRLSVPVDQTVYFAYLPNGHIVKDKKAIGTQHGIYWTGQVGTSLTLTLEMTQDNLMDGYTMDFDDGNCGETTDYNGSPGGRAGDGKPCIGKFVVPTGTTPGVYKMVWYWTFWLENESSYVDQSQARGYFGAAYSTCFEVEVTAGSGSSTTESTTTSAPEATTASPQAATSPPIATTAAPESTTAAPESTTAAPESTTSAPVATTTAPISTTATPVATTAAPVATTAAPDSVVQMTITASTTETPAATSKTITSWSQVDANSAAGEAYALAATTSAPVATSTTAPPAQAPVVVASTPPPTQTPEGTTATPTAAPVSTTVAPPVETPAPVVTTAAPVSTTETPAVNDTPTPAPEDTTTTTAPETAAPSEGSTQQYPPADATSGGTWWPAINFASLDCDENDVGKVHGPSASGSSASSSYLSDNGSTNNAGSTTSTSESSSGSGVDGGSDYEIQVPESSAGSSVATNSPNSDAAATSSSSSSAGGASAATEASNSLVLVPSQLLTALAFVFVVIAA